VNEYLEKFPVEGETPLFTYIGKLFVSGEEVGNGAIQILKSNDSGICRILMRKNKTYEILLNHFITLDIYLFPLENRWICNDFSCGRVELKDVNLVFPKGDFADKFREAFNEGRKQADIVQNASYNTTISETLQKIIKYCKANENGEEYDEQLVSGIKFFVADDSFFKLPLKVINRVIKKSGVFFSVPEAKRFMFLANKEYPGECITLLQSLRCTDLTRDSVLEILSTVSNCPLLVALSSGDKAPALSKSDQEHLKAANEMVNDEVIFSGIANVEMKGKLVFNGECVVLITKNSENYKIAFIDTSNMSVVDEHVVEDTHHLWPNYHRWTANETVYMVEFQKFQKNVDRDFEAAQYKAKYNIRSLK
jgi:hypothetical protein